MSFSAATMRDVMHTNIIVFSPGDVLESTVPILLSDQLLVVVSNEHVPLIVVDDDSLDRYSDSKTRSDLAENKAPGWNLPALTTAETSLLAGLGLLIKEPTIEWHVVCDDDEIIGVVSKNIILRELARSKPQDLGWEFPFSQQDLDHYLQRRLDWKPLFPDADPYPEVGAEPSVERKSGLPYFEINPGGGLGPGLSNSEMDRFLQWWLGGTPYYADLMPYFRSSPGRGALFSALTQLAGDPMHSPPKVCYRCAMHSGQALGPESIGRDENLTPICLTHQTPVTPENPCNRAR
jgi:hypothetical protein